MNLYQPTQRNSPLTLLFYKASALPRSEVQQRIDTCLVKPDQHLAVHNQCRCGAHAQVEQLVSGSFVGVAVDEAAQGGADLNGDGDADEDEDEDEDEDVDEDEDKEGEEAEEGEGGKEWR